MKIQWNVSLKNFIQKLLPAHWKSASTLENLIGWWKYVNILLVLEIKYEYINGRKEKQYCESLILIFSSVYFSFLKNSISWRMELSYSVRTQGWFSLKRKTWILFLMHLFSDLLSLKNSFFILFNYYWMVLFIVNLEEEWRNFPSVSSKNTWSRWRGAG